MSTNRSEHEPDFGPLTTLLKTLPAGPNLPGLKDQPVRQATLAAIADLFALPSELGFEQLLPEAQPANPAATKPATSKGRTAHAP